MASASMVISTMFPTTIPPFQGRHSTSVGESNAVFLRGVGGDAATEPHKTECSGYPEEEFSGTHKYDRGQESAEYVCRTKFVPYAASAPGASGTYWGQRATCRSAEDLAERTRDIDEYSKCKKKETELREMAIELIGQGSWPRLPPSIFRPKATIVCCVGRAKEYAFTSNY